ncbi:unnamed protein product [Closterium sp. NIES-53]
MRSLRTAQDYTGTVRRCSRPLLLACHCFSRPSSSALPVFRAVRLCHNRGPRYPPSGKRRNSKGKGGKGGGGGSWVGGGGSSGGGEGSGGGGGGSGGGSGGFGGGDGGSGGGGGSGGSGSGGSRAGAMQRGDSGGGQRQQQQRQSETPSPQQLQFGDEAERPRWAEMLRSGVAIFDLDYDAILATMHALSVSAEGDCYLCVPRDPGIEAAALGAIESDLPRTAPAEALHTFKLYSGGQRVSICTCTRTGRHLATFTCWPGSSLYALATEPPHVAASAQVSASGPIATPCSCRLLSHQTLLWHHCLCHPSMPRLRGMHSRLLVYGLPKSLPPLSPSPAPPCLPCVEGQQRATPHSSSFPPTTAPLQTLHMDVWGPARVNGEGRECYFLLVVDDYMRYSTVFPLRSKGEVPDVLIPWIRSVRLQLRERFRQDLPVLRLHSDRGGEFFSDLHRIGLVMEVARASMIHAVAPHFLWPFAVWYAAHQLNLWPCVSLLETSPTLRWTGKVGDASVFRVWGSFLPPHLALFLALPLCPSPPKVLLPQPGGAESEGAGSRGAEPAGGEPAGVESGGAEPADVEPGGAEPADVEPRGPAGASPRLSPRPEPLSPQQLREWFDQRTCLWSGAAAAGDSASGDTGAAGPGGDRTRGTGAAGTGGVGGIGAGGAGAGDPAEPGVAGAGGTGAGGAGVGGVGAGDTGAVGVDAGGTGAGGARAGGAGAVDNGAGGAGGAGAWGAVLGLPSSTGLTPPLLCPPPDQSQQPLQPASPRPAPSPYTEQTGGPIECHELESRPASPVPTVCTARRVPRSRPPPVHGTHAMALCPSSIPLRIPLPAPPDSSLPAAPDPESHHACAATPTVSRLLATLVNDPSFQSSAASALVAELVDFATTCRLDYATALVVESESASPPSVGGECALGTNVFEGRQEDFECLAAAVPRLASMLLAPEVDPDAPDIRTPRSYAEAITGTYVDAVPPSQVNIVDGMWIFRVKRPAFKARYVARGFSQRPFTVWYAAHQLNLWPSVSLPETLPTLRWTGGIGDASMFRVWGSRAFVHDTSVDKLSAHAIPCVFLGFPLDAPGWQFYHPTFDESVPFYRLFPYRSAPPPPPLLFLAPSPPPVDPLPPQGPAPSGVSQVDPLPGTVPVEVAIGSGAARGAASVGAASVGAASGGAEPRGVESEGVGSGGVEPGGSEPGGAEPAGVDPGGAEPAGVEPGGAESECAEFGGVEPRGTASSGGPAGASPQLSPRPKPLSPQQLRKWFAQHTCHRSGAARAGDPAAGDIGAGGAGVIARAGVPEVLQLLVLVKRPLGSPPAFKVRYVARGFSQRQGVDYFQTFSPTPKMTTLRVLLHVATQRDYELHSLDFSTAFLQGSLYEEIWLRRPPSFTGSFPVGTQWSLRWPASGTC